MAGVDIDAEPGTAPVADAAAGSGMDVDVPEILDSVNAMIATQFAGGQLRTQMQTQPCLAAGFIREIMFTVLEPKLNWRQGWADKAEQFLGGWVRESIQRQGRPGGGLVGGKSLAKFIIDNGPREPYGSGFIPAVVRVLLWGPAPEADWLNAHLPSGSALASGAWRNHMDANAAVRANGERLADGVYLYPVHSIWDPGRQGAMLRGPAVRRIIEQWIEFQVENVRGADWPSPQWPRPTLTKMVGTWKGTGPYGLWQRSDGALPGSRLSNINLLWDDAASLLAEASDRCDLQWQIEQEAAYSGISLTETQILADIETQKKKAERQERLAIGALAVLGLFAVTR